MILWLLNFVFCVYGKFLDRSYMRSSWEKWTSILKVFREHALSFANKQIVCYNVFYSGCFFVVFDNKCVWICSVINFVVLFLVVTNYIYMFILLFFQYGRILDIELKIPPRPPCYCFVEVFYSLNTVQENFKKKTYGTFPCCQCSIVLSYAFVFTYPLESL